MNIFCLSDLHLQRIWVAEALTEGKLAPFIEQIKHLFQMVKVDAVVITGDTVQSDMIRYLNALSGLSFRRQCRLLSLSATTSSGCTLLKIRWKH